MRTFLMQYGNDEKIYTHWNLNKGSPVTGLHKLNRKPVKYQTLLRKEWKEWILKKAIGNKLVFDYYFKICIV